MSKSLEPIAEDHWSYKLEDVTVRVARVVIGRPRIDADDPNGDWTCPVFFEGITDDVLWVNGVGPVDAVLNASRFLSERFFELKEVSPRANPKT